MPCCVCMVRHGQNYSPIGGQVLGQQYATHTALQVYCACGALVVQAIGAKAVTTLNDLYRHLRVDMLTALSDKQVLTAQSPALTEGILVFQLNIALEFYVLAGIIGQRVAGTCQHLTVIVQMVLQLWSFNLCFTGIPVSQDLA